MSKKWIWLLGMLFVALTTQAQSGEEAQVLSALETWKKALLEKNVTVLKEVLAEDLSYGHSNSKIETKAKFIGAIESGAAVYKTLEMPDMEIKITGKTAIVRHKMFADIVDEGKAMKTNLGVLQVWIKKKGKWQLLARQAFRLL